ncbi:MAG: serine/threonine protein kinase [Chloracidobacterium sp.]|nr:serine/threonine protein kinase [Chloracidobacterium sp.]
MIGRITAIDNIQIDNWKEIKSLLMNALALDPPSRSDFLDRQHISPEIRSEVESLLALEDAADGIFDKSALELSKEFLLDHAEDLSVGNGQTIGPYKLVSELGLGGMGAVYLAERSDERFEQQVAIKLLKREFNVDRLRRSFKREIDILAKLSHPNIATIYDTGTTTDGIPYIVMEYIDGVPIDRYCDQHGLGLIERLKLFNKASEAVGYAHQNLIVHRDIKPSNILVSSDGVPKLLDFGISKALDSAEDGSSTTIMGAMTPEYASPEQIDGGRITTSTDIYSLGMVLFKLLTGTYPYNFKKGSSSDILREITDEDPILPSQTEDTRSSVERNELKGDIDNIVLKALSKEPQNRYSTVRQFAEDIWRYIDGEPVTARPATVSYRLNKFYKRNKIAVTAGVLIFATLIGGISVALWQARIAHANAAVAVAESDNAKDEQKKAEKISSFMMKFFRYANPKWYAEGYPFGGETRVIDALDDMAPKIDTEFADQPDVLAEMHHHFGDAFMARKEPGGREKAKFHFQRAFEVRRSYYGGWHELLAKDMLYLYWVQEPPRSEEAVKMLSDAIVMMRATNPKNLNLPYMLEDYFHRLSDDEYAQLHEMFLRNVPQPAPNDKYLAADQLFDEMLGLLNLHFPKDSEQVVYQKCSAMSLKFKVGKTAQAEEFYEECRKRYESDTLSEKTKSNGAITNRLAEYRKLLAQRAVD